MAVDLRWRDACTASRAFTAEQKAAGWPETMTVAQLAAIQRPYQPGEGAGRRSAAALQAALDAACKEGGLVHEAQSKVVRTLVVDHVPTRLNDPSNWDPAYVRDGQAYAYSTGGDEYTVTSRLVSPRAFASWLHSQGEAPSTHVSAWFSAKGVAWPPIEVVAVAPKQSAFPLADFAALVAYRAAQKSVNVEAGKPRKNIPWTDGNQLDVLRAEYGRRDSNTGAADGIAKALTISRQAVEAALKAERKRQGNASWRGLSAA